MNKINRDIDIKDILKPISKQLGLVDENIREMLKTGIPLLDRSAVHLFIKGGKMVRASLVLLSSGIYGELPHGIIDIAAATEVVHAATLVHDDIIDHSIMRRGDVTVSEKWGNKIAVLVGDYMYTRALDAVVKDNNPDLFSIIVSGTNDMVKGELYQLQYSGIDVINKDHYLNIIELKTARFMAACAKLGAIKAGLSMEEREWLYDFGLNMGFAFQIIDDTLDLIDEGVTGKDSGNDFKDGKVTLPFLHLLERSSSDDQNTLRGYAANPSDDNWDFVRTEIIKNSAIDYSVNLAKEYIKSGFDSINNFPDSKSKEVLISLGNFIASRCY